MRRSIRALLAGLAIAITGCVDYDRGAVVQMNIVADGLPVNVGETHYALYALINGGPVAIERFKVLGNIDECLANPQLVSTVLQVARFELPDGLLFDDDKRTLLCGAERRLGALDTIDPAAGLLVGGIRIDTSIDLSTAERLFVTAECDRQAVSLDACSEAAVVIIDDRPPGEAVLVADVAPGIAPFDAECSDPVPESRRGVRRGAWVRAPGETPCAGRVGTIAVVPAVDETR